MLEVSRVPSLRLNQFLYNLVCSTELLTKATKAMSDGHHKEFTSFVKEVAGLVRAGKVALFAYRKDGHLVGCTGYTIDSTPLYTRPVLAEAFTMSTTSAFDTCTLGRKLEAALAELLAENGVAEVSWLIGSTTLKYQSQIAYAKRLGFEEHGTAFIKTLKASHELK